MSEALLLKLIDAALTAASVGLEREAVLARVTEMQAKGATPEEIAAGLVRMRDEAIAAAQARISAA
jgi:hypothetical protein